ncbi:XylR family transcriptional regulator [Marispirochaeta sp.]|uniref:AraC family transcriptional regulator n=1 Tax=Marispirochaeta sp. TaxID=2038653 RepID=UPI0029C9780E|nr:XylR family transcriptional regulator [Marispirochaeta sp.]
MKHVALGMGLSDYYDHGIARGIVRYAKEQPGWRLYGHGWMFSPLEDLSNWNGDGVIARIEYEEQVQSFSKLECPVVDVANAFRIPRVFNVSNDDYETGKLAGRYFSENGFTSFAYCGTSPGEWSRERLEGFKTETGFGDLPCFERPLKWWLKETYSVELALFLAKLPRPAALFTCNDKVGLRVSSICAGEGFAVPDELAILGVDNEDIPCELANPSLSSIELRLETIGAMAAARLDELMRSPGSTPRETKAVKVTPMDIIERKSSSAYASRDPLVVDVFRLIRAQDGHLRSVSDLVEELAMGRRSLETRFKQETGKTLHQSLISQKIRVASRILRTTNKTMEAVADEAGFGSTQRFFAHFRKQTGTTPADYRRAGNTM